jgi:hypothetical protein
MSQTRSNGEPPPSFIYVVGRVDQGIRREMRNRLAQCGLSVQEYTALLDRGYQTPSSRAGRWSRRSR